MAGLTIRPAFLALSLAFVYLVAAAAAQVAWSDELPVSESEAHDFLQEFNWVNRSCDADQLQQLIFPDATITFTMEGEGPTTVSRYEYLREFRKQCFHTRQSYDRSSFSVRIDRGRAVMTGRWEHGQQIQFFFLDSQDIDWVEEKLIVMREGDALGLQEMNVTTAIKPKPEPLGGVQRR